MSKAVLISIRPEWAKLILSGEKTLEVRKNRPRLETPFRCYIYETIEGRGTVVAEFVCDQIECVDIPYPALQKDLDKRYIEQSCVRYYALHRYVYHDSAYFWHISDLKIYDQPKDLSAFMRPCTNDLFCEVCAMYHEFEAKCGNGALAIKRAPQSWCYVEEL